MTDVGIQPGDMLIVDKSIEPTQSRRFNAIFQFNRVSLGKSNR
ncbi:hypothetical protein PXX05_05680 [Legionella cardiaca]|uniref:Signal peptidase I n=1 Tax=Legionella cardiaca TaxID=1071983 RepID=A0ABY8AXQ0_9GAMM|nr:hypothetical protein [Legionella cardiaca]WED44275.1 hypothetical protein PXX05_05680 [Legionella cardiaca]